MLTPRGKRRRKAMKERKWGSEEDGVGYGRNGVIIVKRLQEESPSSVFKGAVRP